MTELDGRTCDLWFGSPDQLETSRVCQNGQSICEKIVVGIL